MIEDKAEATGFFDKLRYKPGKKPDDIFIQGDFSLPSPGVSLDGLLPTIDVNMTKEEQ